MSGGGIRRLGALEFCGGCGTLLGSPGKGNEVACARCGLALPVADFCGDWGATASSRAYAFQKPKFDTMEAKAAEGAKADEACPACGKREMTFTTAQLRSADEGQTIFFSCGACGHTYSLNS